MKPKLRHDDRDTIIRRIHCKIYGCTAYVEVTGLNGHTPPFPSEMWSKKEGWICSSSLNTQLPQGYTDLLAGASHAAFCPKHKHLYLDYRAKLLTWDKRRREVRSERWKVWMATPFRFILGKFISPDPEPLPEPPWTL